jgi:cephalosporin-C deacetylase-like acetyl esterase
MAKNISANIKKTLSVAVGAVLSASAFGEYTGKIALNRPDGFYKSGETCVCTVTLCRDGVPLDGVKGRLTVKRENRMVRSEEFVTAGKPLEFSYTGDRPGWVYFRFELLGKDGEPLRANSSESRLLRERKPTVVAEIGAIFDADRIVSPVREPADFDDFWAKRKAEADAHELAPTLVELPSGTPGVKLYSVTLSCPRGVTATGYLALPEVAKPRSLPGYLFFQSLTYSDIGRQYAVERAKCGALAFAATWHGFPSGKPAEYYPETIKPYFQNGLSGVGDREKWVFSDMFFRVLCELRFLKERPEWDGRTLVVYGGSLGGIQSAFAAAIDTAVTTAVVSVPGFCECNAFEAGRTPYGVFRTLGADKLRERPELLDMGFYFDSVNFAKRIRCEVHVCTGFTDETCYPSNVFAFYNAISNAKVKTMTTDPRTGHFNTTRNVKGDSRVDEIFRSTAIGGLPK